MKKRIKRQIRKSARLFAPLFDLYQWTWVESGLNIVPGEKDIERAFISLYKSMKKYDSLYSESGRLVVMKHEKHEYSFLLEGI